MSKTLVSPVQTVGVETGLSVIPSSSTWQWISVDVNPPSKLIPTEQLGLDTVSVYISHV